MEAERATRVLMNFILVIDSKENLDDSEMICLGAEGVTTREYIYVPFSQTHDHSDYCVGGHDRQNRSIRCGKGAGLSS